MVSGMCWVTPKVFMDKTLILLGSGGHAKVLLDIVGQQNTTLLGILDPKLPVNSTLWGFSVLGDDMQLLHYPASCVLLVNGLGSIPFDAGRRAQVFSIWTARGYCFHQVIHASAIIARNATLQTGVQIMAGAIVQADTHIGANSLINTGAIVEHDCRIGQSVHIAPGAVLSGGVCVGDNVHIGTNATIIQGISIGNGSIIGAGAVVTQTIAPGHIVYPARSQSMAINPSRLIPLSI